MKSILQSIALVSAVILVAACDSSDSGGGVTVTPPGAQEGAAGSGVKGIIVGGTVEVTDSTGTQCASTTTGADGSYAIVFDEDVCSSPTPPYTITITGGEVKCDIDNEGTTDDCITGVSGGVTQYVAFGESYTPDSDFAVVAILPAAATGTDPTNIAHVNTATDIAAIKAVAAGGSAADVTTANAAIKGFIEAISGIDLGDTDLTEIAPVDITTSTGSGVSAAQLAVSAFAAAAVAAQTPGETLKETLARLAGLITIDASGNVTGTGTALGTLAAAFARGLSTASAKISNAALRNAATTATASATALTNQGSATVTIPGSGTAPDDDTQATKDFVATLSTVIADLIDATGAEGTDIGITEVFANQLDAQRLLSSEDATAALSALVDAIDGSKAAAAEGEVVVEATEESPIGYTLSLADGVYTLTEATSTSGDVTITVASGTEGSAEISLTDVEMTDGVQTFTGSAGVVYGEASDVYSFDGDITIDGTDETFSIVLSYTDAVEGEDSYEATFEFDSDDASGIEVVFEDTVGSTTQTYTITTDNGSITGTVTRTDGDLVVITDGVTVLTITVTQGVAILPANFTVGDTTTATLDSNGVVTYEADGSIQFLPAIIF